MIPFLMVSAVRAPTASWLALNYLMGEGGRTDGTEHFEDGTEDHGLSVRDRSRRDRGSPSVCDIIYHVSTLVTDYLMGKVVRVLTGTIVVGVKESKEGTDSKHVCVLVESHFG